MKMNITTKDKESQIMQTKRHMKRFDNRTVIVTGGARGMGASHARGFVAEGANVVIADVLEQEGRTLADELGEHAIFSRLDVTNDKDWATTVAAAEDAFGPECAGRCASIQTLSRSSVTKRPIVSCLTATEGTGRRFSSLTRFELAGL